MPSTRTDHRAPWIARSISRTAADPSCWFGRLLGSIWWWETAAVNAHAVRLLDIQPGWLVLELGFGPGRTIRRMVRSGARVIGVDVSAQMCRLAARHNRTAVRAGTVTVHRGDGIALPVSDGWLDGAISVHTTYFWPDPAGVTAELGRALRPGGRLVLGLRDPDLPLSRRADPEIYQQIPLDRLRELLEAAGLQQVTVVREPDVAPDAVWVITQRTAPQETP